MCSVLREALELIAIYPAELGTEMREVARNALKEMT